MAFRHGEHGVLTTKSAIWFCPSCGKENTGPLEAGCACGVYKDAKKVTPVVKDNIIIPAFDPKSLDPQEVAFSQWYNKSSDHLDAHDMSREAFAAGVAWARGNPLPRPVPLPSDAVVASGGWNLAMTHSDPSTWGDPEHMNTPLDKRAQETIKAALAFYRDNTLQYGPIPGQLSAAECTQLIATLSAPEEG